MLYAVNCISARRFSPVAVYPSGLIVPIAPPARTAQDARRILRDLGHACTVTGDVWEILTSCAGLQ